MSPKLEKWNRGMNWKNELKKMNLKDKLKKIKEK